MKYNENGWKMCLGMFFGGLKRNSFESDSYFSQSDSKSKVLANFSNFRLMFLGPQIA